MTTRARIAIVAIRLIVLLALVLTPIFFVYRWPLDSLLVLYLAGCAVVGIREVRRALRPPPADNPLSSLLLTFFRTALSANSRVNLARRYLSVGFRMLGQIALWPKNVLLMVLARRLYRRDSAGRLVPRAGRPLLLFYGQYAVDLLLFLALPFVIVYLARSGRAANPVAWMLFAVLSIGLLSRHLSMLIFPQDLKESMRRTAGDPRVMFFAYLCVDTFAFAVLVQFVRAGNTPVSMSIDALTRAAMDLVSLSQVRLTMQQVKQAFDVNGFDAQLLAPLAGVTLAQSFEALCSGFVSLNIVRLVFPLRSWERTDDDRKAMARGFLLFGQVKDARDYLEQVKDYDVDAAEIDAWIAASEGDLEKAATKIRWMHARNALREDSDLVFLDVIGSPTLIGTAAAPFRRVVAFASDLSVSDPTLAVLALFKMVTEQLERPEAREMVAATPLLERYPLTTAVLELSTGDVVSVRRRLDQYVPADVVSHCFMIMLREMAHSWTEPEPDVESFTRAADSMVSLVSANLEQVKLSGLLTLVSILIDMRRVIAATGGSTKALADCTAAVVEHIKNHYPSYRSKAATLGHFSRAAEMDIRREAKHKRPAPVSPAAAGRGGDRAIVG
jgi:hypothetical protein